MQKKQNTYKEYCPWESQFSYRFAAWAHNHRGWSKMKRTNRRIAKKRLRRVVNKSLFDFL